MKVQSVEKPNQTRFREYFFEFIKLPLWKRKITIKTYFCQELANHFNQKSLFLNFETHVKYDLCTLDRKVNQNVRNFQVSKTDNKTKPCIPWKECSEHLEASVTWWSGVYVFKVLYYKWKRVGRCGEMNWSAIAQLEANATFVPSRVPLRCDLRL